MRVRAQGARVVQSTADPRPGHTQLRGNPSSLSPETSRVLNLVSRCVWDRSQ